MKNVLRATKNKVNAEFRERNKSLKKEEAFIRTLFQDGQKEIPFCYDAFSTWGGGAFPESINAYCNDQKLYTDPWHRAVWELNEEQAITLGRLVEAWNFDNTDEEGRNPWNITFSPTSGSEHTISVRSPNGHYSESWQR